MTSSPAVYRVADLAERWQCTQATIRRMIMHGDIEAFRVGILTRISAREVEKWESTHSELASKAATNRNRQ